MLTQSNKLLIPEKCTICVPILKKMIVMFGRRRKCKAKHTATQTHIYLVLSSPSMVRNNVQVKTTTLIKFMMKIVALAFKNL